MKIIAVFNIKGGVGKTATAVNLAFTAANEGNKVLLVDLDPQGASTFYFQLERVDNTKKLITGNTDLSNAVHDSGYANLDILPASSDYRKMDVYLNSLKTGSSRWLSNLFKPVKKTYDYVILDCPPNVSLYSENILRNSDLVLVPVIPTTLSVRTYDQLLEFCTQQKIDKKKLHPFFSMYEMRKSLHNETISEFVMTHKETINVVIPYKSDVEKMGLYQAPYTARFPNSEITYLYKELWKAAKKKV
jgi:cellulose biosynthesis protein BcsQ